MDKEINSCVENRCTFIGLPSSGKTSFIGAFWHVVESGEIDTVYKVTVPPSDREYLNSLRKNFLDCEAPERTKSEFVKQIEIQVEEFGTNKKAAFVFPDLSGETFESQFEYRKLSNDYLSQLAECNSVMLFVNPSKIKKSFLISAVNGMFDEEEESSTQGDAVAAAPIASWTPKMCQTQVILVDLLQIIKKNIQTPCKVGLVISAWDTIKNSPDPVQAGQTPDEWLKLQLPLLYQFLEANKAQIPTKVFGISAQGGEYKEDENDNLLMKNRQSERLIVQSGQDITHDITVPLKWFFDE